MRSLVTRSFRGRGGSSALFHVKQDKHGRGVLVTETGAVRLRTGGSSTGAGCWVVGGGCWVLGIRFFGVPHCSVAPRSHSVFHVKHPWSGRLTCNPGGSTSLAAGGLDVVVLDPWPNRVPGTGATAARATVSRETVGGRREPIVGPPDAIRRIPAAAARSVSYCISPSLTDFFLAHRSRSREHDRCTGSTPRPSSSRRGPADDRARSGARFVMSPAAIRVVDGPERSRCFT